MHRGELHEIQLASYDLVLVFYFFITFFLQRKKM